MPTRCTLGAAVLGLLLLGGCALGGEEAAANLQPRANLGRKAMLAAANQTSRRAAPGEEGPATVEAGSAPALAEGRKLASVQDQHGDHGDGPRYADVVEVAFTDSDEGLAVSVQLGAVVPGRLERGELQHVGVDVYRVSPLDAVLGQTGSDYQMRLEGGAYGWRAFLRAPDGYVGFPGTFTVSERTLHVVVPWEAVGGRKRAMVETFVDWSAGVGRLSTDGAIRTRLVPE